MQVGVGVKAGCEVIVHSVAHILEKQDQPSLSRWILLVDFSNAFNCVNREIMFSAIRTVLPGLSRWVECSYSTDSVLHFGDHSLLSHCGIQQGDLLGPLCFALTVQPIAMLRGNFQIYSVWYLDDVTICGSPQNLTALIEKTVPGGVYMLIGQNLFYIFPQMIPSNNM